MFSRAIATKILCLVVLPQRHDYIQSCYRNENIIFSRATATTWLYSVVLSQRHYYIQSCYRNDTIIFSRATATRILYLVVLTQREYYIQSCYRNENIIFSRAIATTWFLTKKMKLECGIYLWKWYNLALLNPKLYFTLFAIFGINFCYF